MLEVFAQIPDTSAGSEQDRVRWANLTELMDDMVGRHFRDHPDEEALLGLAEDLVAFAQRRGPRQELDALYANLRERLHPAGCSDEFAACVGDAVAQVAEVLMLLAQRSHDFGADPRAYETFRRDLAEAFQLLLRHASQCPPTQQLAPGGPLSP